MRFRGESLNWITRVGRWVKLMNKIKARNESDWEWYIRKAYGNGIG